MFLMCFTSKFKETIHCLPNTIFCLQSMIGHCLGAAGGLEAIATVKAITTGWVHPSINQFVSTILKHHLLIYLACQWEPEAHYG